jgi:hypothetical protein
MSPIDHPCGRRVGGLWAVTAYFNPMGYRRRLTNYKLFRTHLNVPLVAVELAYGPDFELNSHDADILVQLRGRDILWQKERLLNSCAASVADSMQKCRVGGLRHYI